jgi:hypothetical protein
VTDVEELALALSEDKRLPFVVLDSCPCVSYISSFWREGEGGGEGVVDKRKPDTAKPV